MPWIRVHLSPDDLAKVRDLRKWGVNVCEVMRNAIRAEHERRTRTARAGRTSKRSSRRSMRKIPTRRIGRAKN